MKIKNFILMAFISLGLVFTSCGKNDNPLEEIINEVATQLAELSDALEEGALVTITVKIDGVDTDLTFKKVGDTFVYQEPAGTRAVAGAVYTLTYVEAENQLVFSVKKATGELVYGVIVDMDDNSYTPLASTDPQAANYSFTGGLSVNDTDQTLSKVENTEYLLMITDLKGNAITDISSMKITKAADGSEGADVTASGGWLTYDKAGMGSDEAEFWFEATSADGKKYIAKKNINPAELTSETAIAMATYGNIIGDDGSFYADKAAVEEASANGVAMIAYIGDDADTSDETVKWHGLAMALTQVSGNFKFYGASEGAALDGPESVDDNLPMNGIKNTRSMKDKNYLSATAVAGYRPAAPAGTSGWFLPCVGQFYKVCTAIGVKEWHSHDISTDGMVATVTDDYQTLFNATGYENVLPVSTAFCNSIGIRFYRGYIATDEITMGYESYLPLGEDSGFEEPNTSARAFLAF